MTNISINSQNQPTTMTTREIAELVDKEHFHVKRDTEAMLAELQIDASRFGCIYLDSLNRQQTEFVLDEELTYTLLTGYSTKLRHKVVKRWKELEAGVKQLAIENQVAQALLEATPLLLEQVEAKYRDQCLHSEEYEVGKALLNTMRELEDRRNKAKTDAAVRECSEQVAQIAAKYELGPQALLMAVTKHKIDAQSEARDARGEHLGEEEVAAQRVLHTSKAVGDKAGRLEYAADTARRRRPMTLDQIIADEERHKHDNPSSAPTPSKRRTATKRTRP